LRNAFTLPHWKWPAQETSTVPTVSTHYFVHWSYPSGGMDGVDAPAVMGSSQMKSKISNISKMDKKISAKSQIPIFSNAKSFKVKSQSFHKNE